MSVKFYYPQASYEASGQLQRLWGWWILMGGLLLGAAGYSRFSEGAIPRTILREISLLGLHELGSARELTDWLARSGLVVLLAALTMSAATTWGVRRRRSFLVQASAGAGLFLGSALFFPTLQAAYSVGATLAANNTADGNFVQWLFFTFVMLGFFLVLLAFQVYLTWKALRESFTKKIHPSLKLSRTETLEDAAIYDLPFLKEIFEENQANALGAKLGPKDGWDALKLENHLDQCRVYRRGHTLVGFCLDSDDSHRLRLIHVLRSRQRSGVGTALLADFERRASERAEEGQLYTSFGPAYPHMGRFLRQNGWQPSTDIDGQGHALYKKPVS